MLSISSSANKKIKDAEKLKKGGARKASGLILVDGLREIELAAKAGWKIEELYFSPEAAKGRAYKPEALGAREVFSVTENVLKKLSYKAKPDGFVAILKERMLALSEIKLSLCPLVVILEAVEKPGNLGAIIRTAYAAGVDAIIINDSQTDIYNPNVIRASEGLIFIEPVVQASREETLAWLEKENFRVFAAATTAKKNYFQANLKEPAALVFGSEADGLSQEWLKAADELVKIPMRPGVDSLNVSVSAALIIYEARRQRGAK